MSRHRSGPPPRVRPRYPRLGTAFVAAVVTLVALLGGTGLLPVHGGTAYVPRVRLADQQTHPGSSSHPTTPTRPSSTTPPGAATSTTSTTALPEDSGAGRRVVFDISAQRVWLVGATDQVLSTYLVSGSLTDNLQPGSYSVYSRSRWAVGVDDSGVMQYFVRFAHGAHAAIGFHSIPTHHGKPLQTEAQLGTPQSHGCIRQAIPDAKRMWRFAQDGTDVVVTA